MVCRVLKLLSEDPSNYKDAPREGIRRILEQLTGEEYPREKPVNTKHISSIRMGTTVATNALLERKGERCALVTTKGFRDLLHIGNQSRPLIFDLEIQIPDTLFETVVEIDEQVINPHIRQGSLLKLVPKNEVELKYVAALPSAIRKPFALKSISKLVEIPYQNS